MSLKIGQRWFWLRYQIVEILENVEKDVDRIYVKCKYVKPITGHGFAIFNKKDIENGNWKLLVNQDKPEFK